MHPILFASLQDIADNFENVGLQTGFSWQQFFAQCFAVIILFSVMYIFAWKKVAVVLEERRKIIEQSLANADKIKSQLADAETTRKRIIQEAGDKANKLVAEAEKSAAAVTERRAQEATRQAEDIIKSAREASILERNRLMEELKRNLGDLVVQTAQKVTGKVLNAEDQARLNSETLTQLGAKNN